MTPRSTRRAAIGLSALLLACKPAPAPSTPPNPPASTLTPGAGPADPAELRGPVASITLVGLASDREARARAALISTIGAAYDPAAVSRDVRALWRLRGIADIQVDARKAADGVALRYRVRELPRVRKIDVQGGSALISAAWRARLDQLADQLPDPTALTALREDIVGEYAASGYLDARAEWRMVDAPDARTDIVYAISPGPQVKLAGVELRGNRRVEASAIQAILRKHGVQPGWPYARDALAAALLRVSDHYLELGHLHVAVGEPAEARSADGASMSVVVEIREGEAFRVGKLAIRGALVAPARDYLKMLGVREGQTFNRTKIAAGVEKIRAFHRERGGPEPDILADTRIDAKTRKVDLSLELGPPKP